MLEIINSIAKLLAGVGLFLFAMYLIEESLKNLSGRNFKLFLQKASKNNITAVSGGAVITGILQSSSMVSIMVLAFVGANVFTLKNALAIILGANLGTTLDSWLVATLGFQMNIELLAYPMIAIGGLLIVILGKRKNIKYIAYFLLGFGLLFIGLSFMKNAMENQVTNFDFSKYNNMPLYIFVIIGFTITLIVQSSSVTMALTLSALHVGVISFPYAIAIVLGSETGTTIKIVLSAIGGSATKKRVVLANLIFNIILTIVAYLFLNQLITLITKTLNITNPLIGLVTFSTLINLLSLIIFIPFLNPISKLLLKLFKNSAVTNTTFIQNANLLKPESAAELFKKESSLFLFKCLLFNLEIFDSKKINFILNNKYNSNIEHKNPSLKNIEEKYQYLKQLQGEIQSFYLDLYPLLLGDCLSDISTHISSVRGSMYSVKCINDIKSNIDNLKRSSKNIKYNFIKSHQLNSELLYNDINNYLFHQKEVSYKILKQKLTEIQNKYNKSLTQFYKDAQDQPLEDSDITIILNFKHTLFDSDKAILFSAKDLLLKEKESILFNKEPVYIT